MMIDTFTAECHGIIMSRMLCTVDYFAELNQSPSYLHLAVPIRSFDRPGIPYHGTVRHPSVGWNGMGWHRLAVPTQVLMEIRRLVVESEAAHPTARGSGGGITFSGNSGAANPRLLKRPNKPAG